MPELIRDHVWRSLKVSFPVAQCAYMNCRRPVGEHARAVPERHNSWPSR